jgi:hypothetical protein
MEIFCIRKEYPLQDEQKFMEIRWILKGYPLQKMHIQWIPKGYPLQNGRNSMEIRHPNATAQRLHFFDPTTDFLRIVAVPSS